MSEQPQRPRRRTRKNRRITLVLTSRDPGDNSRLLEQVADSFDDASHIYIVQKHVHTRADAEESLSPDEQLETDVHEAVDEALDEQAESSESDSASEGVESTSRSEGARETEGPADAGDTQACPQKSVATQDSDPEVAAHAVKARKRMALVHWVRGLLLNGWYMTVRAVSDSVRPPT